MFIMFWKSVLITISFFLLTFNSQGAVVTVSANGQGDYVSIQKAIDNLRAFTPEAHVIYLKPGIYKEKIVIPTWMTKLSILGDDAKTTVISWDDYSGKVPGMTTFTSYTTLIAGNDIYVKNVTFENTAGRVGQAVAIHVEGDRVVFDNCRFLGNQDTVYLGREGARQLFHNCYIEGTTDFIFGPSTAVFNHCIIHSKCNSYITAASTPEKISFGLVFIECKLTADEGVNSVYLGRPWRDYARTVFINCEMGAQIVPVGWHNWRRPEAEKTVFYAESGSYGPGKPSGKRVEWARLLSKQEVAAYTVDNVLAGFDLWKPQMLLK
jgi:pectinesterase